MPEYTEICIWIQKDEHNALNSALADQGMKLEDKLMEKFKEIYCVYVPQTQRDDIAARVEAQIQKEREEAAQMAAERYRESVLKVCGGGNAHCWKIAATVSDLHIARLLRKVLRSSVGDSASAFDELLNDKSKIDSEEFDRVAGMFLRGEKPAANAVTLDFGKGIVTLADQKNGYLTYRMKDISTAIYQAERAQNIPEQKNADRFYQHLTRKALRIDTAQQVVENQAQMT